MKSQMNFNQIFSYSFASAMILALGCMPAEEQASITTITPEEMCGTIRFSDGCSPALDSMIAYGIALVHHMTYDEAEGVFDKVISADPDCFWGHWGKAMTKFHPLWPDRVSEEDLQQGRLLAQRALELAKKEREKYFGQAVAAFYESAPGTEEPVRLAAFEEGWKAAHTALPKDEEASAFYALSMLSTASPRDKTYEKQLKAGKLAQSIITTIPDHPGGFHYTIHAYDFPPLAEKALEVANNYGKIAPEIPHALHMPSHIFTRRGYWKESIHWNARSDEAAMKRSGGGNVSMHSLHALDYLTYAHLQLGEDEAAEAIRVKVENIDKPIDVNPAAAYALAAIPARLPMERGLWEVASKLELPRADRFAWEKFPQYTALTYFAKGVGAAKSGKLDIAREALRQIDTIHTGLLEKASDAYWATQVEIKKKAVEAWIAFSEGNREEALKLMRESADLESSTDKNPVTPGELLPAREMLGDMLMKVEDHKGAFDAYKASLEGAPNRLNTLYGAGLAAEKLGDVSAAREFYSQVLQLVSGTSQRESVNHARNYMETKEQ